MTCGRSVLLDAVSRSAGIFLFVAAIPLAVAAPPQHVSQANSAQYSSQIAPWDEHDPILNESASIADSAELGEPQLSETKGSGYSRIKQPTQLGPGSGYVLKNPDHSWGTAETVSALYGVLEAMVLRDPSAPELVVGDISKRSGGKLGGHLSHRSGNDIDIGLPCTNGAKFGLTKDVRMSMMDTARTWELVSMLLETGLIEFIFLDYQIQQKLHRYATKKGIGPAELALIFQFPNGRHSQKGIVRHERGHDDHLHVRFNHEVPMPAAQELAALLRGESPETVLTGDGGLLMQAYRGARALLAPAPTAADSKARVD